ncbi:hypothetical protein Z517_07955 [Fonsecaea pedrosoi CBS 271.37]|uniref:Uncharacterized protein n=1 Tax=Fonsecaea pedrosoi CBS 271.37 TaxID=1442368 RepID=A0A0D2EV67_9EURO|nr:uncharacterized protein Z517_07955 [Fonsecaea pedrosoi CBS 271.37]KIW78122.1 hypothetical protein Z517_07955 [Fonsecaea pedrosoi CBS 271.37]
MHFTTLAFRHSSLNIQAPRALPIKATTEVESSSSSSQTMSTTATTTAPTANTADRDCDCDKDWDTHSHSNMEALGVSCWDFAYPTGKCSLPPVKNCSFAAKEKSATTPRRARGERRFKHEDLVTSGCAGGAEMVMVAAAAAVVASGLGPDDMGDGGQCQWQTSSTGTRSRSRSRTQHHGHHDSHHHDSTKPHTNGTSKHHHHHHHNHQPQPRNTTTELRTYLLSCPTIPSITYPHTYTTISTLLLTPRTQLVLLVPQSNILCPKVCELMRLPRAGGSGICILPVPPEIEMRVVTDADTNPNTDSDTATEFTFESDSKVHPNGASDSAREHISTAMSIIDALAVDEVVGKILKNTPARAFDGYVAFEDERAAWTFLHRVGRGVRDKGVGKGKGKVVKGGKGR